MKNSFGQSVIATLFGESHGPAVGIVLDGLAPGIDVSEEEIARHLSRRRPNSQLDTPRQEPDGFQILSGVFNGKTTGTPLCISIPNVNVRSSDYEYGLARPSHADYSAFCKFHGYEDYRGGGHFSGRITAALVAAGGILIPVLEKLGVTIGTHILQCGEARDRSFYDVAADVAMLHEASFPTLGSEAREAICAEITKAREDSDSVGGITQSAICGLPAGVGEPWFDSLESMISHAIFSIGAVKGIEFGSGFELAAMRGSEANDALRMEDGRIITETNRNGGINGGISNGMPIVFQCAVKPTASIAKPQSTVDFTKMENATIEIQGRHDPAIVRRICPVIDSVAALVICDALALRFGSDYLAKGETR